MSSDMQFLLDLIEQSERSLEIESTQDEEYSGYHVKPGDYIFFRDKSIVNRYQDQGKKTNFYHKLHLAVNIDSREDYQKLWRLVSAFVKDYPEVANTKIISIDSNPSKRQPGKEAVVYFAPEFWEGYDSREQMLYRHKSIMRDINQRLLTNGLSHSALPIGDVPVEDSDEGTALVYISPPEYIVLADGSYGNYIMADKRDDSFDNPYQAIELKPRFEPRRFLDQLRSEHSSSKRQQLGRFSCSELTQSLLLNGTAEVSLHDLLRHAERKRNRFGLIRKVLNQFDTTVIIDDNPAPYASTASIANCDV